MNVRTYLNSLDELDLTPGQYDRKDFDKIAGFVPAERREEAFRCYLIERRVALMFQCGGVKWQALGGKSDAQIVEAINAAVTKHRNSRGAKALKAKYGVEAARRITGKQIQ